MGEYNNPTGAKEIYRGIMSILIIMSYKCICTVMASSPLNLFWEPISLKIIKWLLHTILRKHNDLTYEFIYGNGIAQF